jgi:hypothetical protein
VQVQDFVGREWLTAKVDAFLNDDKRKSGVFLLVGEAGVGKTSFIAHLVTERRYLHLFAEQVPGDVNVSRALQSLGAQLVARYQIDPYKEKGTLPAIATFPDFLDKLLRLAADKLSVDEKIVIVCDALDEAGTAPNGNVFGLPNVLPDGVYFVLSQRPVTVKLSVKADLVKETIDASGTDNLHDVEQYLTAVAHRPEVSNQLRAHNFTEADFVRILKERSGGVWMYLFYVVSEIGAGHRAPLDLATLPSGLAGYYTDYWGDWSEGRNGRGDGPAKWDAVYAPLLATLAAAQLPISLKLLMAWSQVQATEYEVERLLRRSWRAFITEREIDHTPHFSLYHASLRDFLTGQVDRQGLTLEAEQLIDELSRRTCDAHARIVEYYRRQCNGDWIKLVDDDYARTYLCLHLAASGDGETMYQLVAMSNAWAEAKYANEESYAGYLVDLNRAWEYAEAESYWSIDRQLRCALIESSIHSLIGNVNPQLLALLIRTKTWSPGRVLSYISQLPREGQRAFSLQETASYLPLELKAEALTDARVISDEGARSWALSGLAPCLPPNLLVEALSIACAISNESNRADALTGLAPYLPEDLLAQALAIAQAISDRYIRVRTLSNLALYLPNDLKLGTVFEALTIARSISGVDDRARAMIGLAPHLPQDLLPEVVAEALVAARAISVEDDRAEALSDLVPYLSDNSLADVLTDVLTIPIESTRVSALVKLAPYLSADLLSEVLTAVRTMSEEERADALINLAPYLSTDLQAEAQAEALASVCTISYEERLAYALSNLAPHLPTDLLVKALSTARNISDEPARNIALSGIALYLPPDLQLGAITQALTTARTISNERNRAWAPIGLAPHLPPHLLAEVMTIASASLRDYHLTHALCELAPHLPPDLLAKALAIACAISNEGDRVDALIGLAPYLPADQLAEALAATQVIFDQNIRVRALSNLALQVPTELRLKIMTEALTVVRTILEEDARGWALIELASHLPLDLPPEIVTEVLVTTRAIPDEDDRIYALSLLTPHLPIDLRTRVQTEAFTAACAILAEEGRARALCKIAPYLPAELLAEAFSAACTISSGYYRSDALIGLVPYLSADLLTEVLTVTRDIPAEYNRARVVRELAPRLSADLLAEALSITNAISSEYCRADALEGLAPYLSAELLIEALAIARTILEEISRARALSSLASRLPADLQLEVVVEVFPATATIGPANYPTVYARLMDPWKERHFQGFRTRMWTDALHSLAFEEHREGVISALNALVPLIEHLGGQSAIEDYYYALRDVTTWWP